MSRAARDAASARPVTVTACPNGPLIVRGDVELVDEHGAPVEARRRTVALCRCGASAIRPFCDGSHRTVGFRTEPPARTPAVVLADPPVAPPLDPPAGDRVAEAATADDDTDLEAPRRSA